MLAARAEEYLQEKGLGYSYPFQVLTPLLREGDVEFANLEGPVTTAGERATDKTFTFKMDPRAVDGIAGAGFTLFSIANNHIMDYGPTGLRNTIHALRSRGMAFAGAGMTITEARAPAIVRVKGLRIALQAYSATFPETFYAGEARPGTAFPHEEYLEEDIPRDRRSADLVIASFHWGQELMEEPKDYQRELAHRAVDLGAGIVLGHHPHVLQGIEVYHGGIIFYSLGNFVFGSYSGKVAESAVVRVTVSHAGLPLTAEVIPIDVYNKEVVLQPRPLTGDRAREALERLRGASEPLGTALRIAGDRGTVSVE